MFGHSSVLSTLFWSAGIGCPLNGAAPRATGLNRLPCSSDSSATRRQPSKWWIFPVDLLVSRNCSPVAQLVTPCLFSRRLYWLTPPHSSSTSTSPTDAFGPTLDQAGGGG